jgi:predicted nucleotidyltransferase component of viral defense system
MDLLTPLQRRLLAEIGGSPLRDQFFLTGGTALAAFYLYHRYSVDLDLFTENPAAVAQVAPILILAQVAMPQPPHLFRRL